MSHHSHQACYHQSQIGATDRIEARLNKVSETMQAMEGSPLLIKRSEDSLGVKTEILNMSWWTEGGPRTV